MFRTVISKVKTGLFWILYRFVTRPSIIGHFVDFIYCQLCEINLRNIWCTQYVHAIEKQTRSSFRLNHFNPPYGHASETRLYSSVYFFLFFQFSYSQPFSNTVTKRTLKSADILRGWGGFGFRLIFLFYPFSSNLKNILSILHFLCLHLMLDDMLHITTRCLLLISYRPDIYRNGS
jgi:hypothetical protein